MSKAMSADRVQSLGGIKKFSAKELIYKNIGHSGNHYLIDCYKDSTLLMTYKGYYNHKTGDFTLYPHKCHKLDSRIPDKHIVHISQIN